MVLNIPIDEVAREKAFHPQHAQRHGQQAEEHGHGDVQLAVHDGRVLMQWLFDDRLWECRLNVVSVFIGHVRSVQIDRFDGTDA